MSAVTAPAEARAASLDKPLNALVVGLNYAPESTGIAPYTTGLARGLSRRGHRVRAIVAHPHYPAWKVHDGYGGWTTREALDGVDVTRVRHYIPTKPSGIRRLVSEISFGLRVSFTRWGNPDVIVSVSPALFATAIAVVRAKLSRAAPAVHVWVQDIYGLGMTETGSGGRMAAKIATLVEKHTLRAATGVVVIHPRFRDHLVSSLGVDPARVRVIRNWTHLEHHSETDPAGFRAAQGWAADETIVLHAGNMGVKQGLANVVDAARLADRSGHRVRFVLLGRGTQKDDLKALGADVTRLQFLDSLDDADFQAALRAADILLVNELPGVSEMAVPSKLTSYFDAGRPVIAATDPAGVTAGEIYASKGGRVVKAGEPQALLDEALALGADPARADELGAAGHKYRVDVLGEDGALASFTSYFRQVEVDAGVRTETVAVEANRVEA
ncbi:glycosyltransferase [Marisediminicola sp. LYQ134]|uniref:glycosyltransferase n=1 Tax=Marisediminicola sp. LYQ134 TaxID=3391061 RepID=UPI003983D4D0